MTRERARFDAAKFELFMAWLGSVFDLFASCLASIARDC